MPISALPTYNQNPNGLQDSQFGGEKSVETNLAILNERSQWFATKIDVANLKSELVQEMRTEMKSQTRWVIGGVISTIVMIAVTFLAALVALIVK